MASRSLYTYFNCISFFYVQFVNNFNVFLFYPKLVMKTKYTDTLIKLLSPSVLTYLLTYFNTVVILINLFLH